MRVYIAGPMRGIPLFNFPAFDAAAQWLRECGHEVFSPAENDRISGLQERDFPTGEFMSHADAVAFVARAMKWDLVTICDCDAIALLPGWEQSAGVGVELSLAKLLKLHVIVIPEGQLELSKCA